MPPVVTPESVLILLRSLGLSDGRVLTNLPAAQTLVSVQVCWQLLSSNHNKVGERETDGHQKMEVGERKDEELVSTA